MIRVLLIAAVGTLLACGKPEYEIGQPSEDIRINQIGYYPNSPKQFVVNTKNSLESFKIVDFKTKESVYEGQLSAIKDWTLAGETVQVGDFSELNISGEYVVLIESLGNSYTFKIEDNLYNDAFKASIKALYYHRASTSLDETHAGQWNRAEGHPDDSVMFHPSSGKVGVTASPGGWYDAGDYGKYVVNGAYPLGQLLSLYEQYPGVLGDNSLNIPESGNEISDYLDELKYEMDWLLTMQDDDGGVFFKLTTKGFEGMILPEFAVKPRYIIGKATAPTLDVAAVSAKMARVGAETFGAEYKENLLLAAKNAWNWAIKNPNVVYKNPEDIRTGEYGDANLTQEFYWAAAELYLATEEELYKEYLLENPISFEFKPGESWANHMHYLAAFSLLDSEQDWIAPLKSELLKSADQLVSVMGNNDYNQPIQDFQWGSNSDVLNTAMILCNAYRFTGEKKYLSSATVIMDYIFGKNANGYSYVTGYGSKTPMFIHHRPSAGDEIDDPVPGFVSGGPNSRLHDAFQVNYPDSVAPMKAWMDVEPSFASNEVCLNWNAPLTYVLGFLEKEANNL